MGGNSTLLPLGGRHFYPLIGVTPKPPASRVDFLLISILTKSRELLGKLGSPLMMLSANLKVLKFSAFIISFLVLFAVREIVAGTYYVATNGSNGNNGSISSPWGRFDHAMTVLRPGDTLIIKDGTYYQSLDIQISGTLGNPITFRAENDGKAIIDGQHVRKACYIGTSSGTPRIHDITVEGIISKRSKYGACSVMQCDRVILKRVSAYDAASGNNSVFDLYFSHDCLIEDCAASGTGRQLFNVFECNSTTLRRCGENGKVGLVCSCASSMY